MNNRWNKLIYKMWAPFYDAIFNSPLFFNARKKVFENIPLQPGSHVLFVGVGTGVDLPFIRQKDIKITAIDISLDMLAQAKKKYSGDNPIEFLEMDAQQLVFPDETFDTVIANLIISVVPNAPLCMNEMIRVTKKQGHILIFDKFVPKDKSLSSGKKMIRPLISLMGTDIGRSFEDIVRLFEHQFYFQEDTPVLFDGMYRKILLQKQ
jgi:phosphatidylethanolamine/phosphatidyl-N-methylethanolamine N-methyltransferase